MSHPIPEMQELGVPMFGLERVANWQTYLPQQSQSTSAGALILSGPPDLALDLELRDFSAGDYPGGILSPTGGFDIMNNHPRVASGMMRPMHWTSLAEAKAARYHVPPGFVPLHDPTLPRTTHEERLAVNTMMASIQDMTAAEDNPVLLGQFSAKLVENDKMYEKGCWFLFEYLMIYHSIPGFLGEKNRRKGKYSSFSEHLTVICEVLRRQKTICRHLTTEDASISLCDDPTGHENRVRTNRVINKSKKEKYEHTKLVIREIEAKAEKGEDLTPTIERIQSASMATQMASKRKASEAPSSSLDTDEAEADFDFDFDFDFDYVYPAPKRGKKVRGHSNASSLVPSDL